MISTLASGLYSPLISYVFGSYWVCQEILGLLAAVVQLIKGVNIFNDD